MSKVINFIITLSLANAELRRGLQDDCVLAGAPLPHDQLKYLVGDSTTPGSIYARCSNGDVICFVEKAIPDKVDEQTIPCESATKPGAQRRLQLAGNTPWPEQTVCYQKPDPQVFTSDEITIIGQIFNDTESKTGVQFVSMANCNNQPNAALICGGCRNYVQFTADQVRCLNSLGYVMPNQPFSLQSPVQLPGTGSTGCFQDFISTLSTANAQFPWQSPHTSVCPCVIWNGECTC